MERLKQMEVAAPTIYYGRILLGEITPLLAAMQRTTPRWSSHQKDNERDPLVQGLRQLQLSVTHLKPNDQLDPSIFLEPFLAVIRSEDTTGPVTKSALAAVNRMLNYGLIDAKLESAAAAVDAVAAAVTHARFVGTDHGADEVVLWEILTVLRTLILGPVGHLLTNESVCEILNSSFRICFETRLSELLRNCTEDALRHMIQLLFARLPQFKDEPQSQSGKKLKMRPLGTVDCMKGKKAKSKPQHNHPGTLLSAPDNSDIIAGGKLEDPEIQELNQEEGESTALLNDPSARHSEELSDKDDAPSLKESLDGGDGNKCSSDNMSEEEKLSESLDISHTHLSSDGPDDPEILMSTSIEEDNEKPESSSPSVTSPGPIDCTTIKEEEIILSKNSTDPLLTTPKKKDSFVNQKGVKFSTAPLVIARKKIKVFSPYGLPCIREVFRFLVSLTSPVNEQNTSTMINTALNLLTVALEIGAEHVNNIPFLLNLVKDKLCYNAFMLLTVDTPPSIFIVVLRLCTLIFESLRTHLKFQLEMFINKLMDIICSESPNVSYTFKELSLETIVMLWRVPGIITELFLNFDCNLYASDLFENLTKILSKNAFPSQGLYSTNLLSLEALLTVIEIIDCRAPPSSKRKAMLAAKEDSKLSTDENNCSSDIPSVVAPSPSGFLLGLGLLSGYSPITPVMKARVIVVDNEKINREALLSDKEKKKVVQTATDLFNIKAEKGIQLLQDSNLLGRTSEDIAAFLRENPHLDKAVLGEFVSKKKHVDILSAFVKSFDFKNQRIDQCLRTFLETFRLPGEAPLIGIIIEHFSSHWHGSNECPFNKEDAAFTLAYAVIMLNVDQHNANAKKQNIPMTLDQFRNNVRGVNDGKDFDQKMLEEIYLAILHEEIVMPAEHTGLVKENYLWKMLLKRGKTKEGNYILANSTAGFDKDLFVISWGPTVASLCYIFDKSTDEVFVHKALGGFKCCASISTQFCMVEVFDNLVVSLMKFTTLNLAQNESPEQIAIIFGENQKAQLAIKTLFYLVTAHGDILKSGWKNIVELLLQLFRCHLLPQSLVESEDFLSASGLVSLIKSSPEQIPRAEVGIFSSLYSYIAMGDGGTRTLTAENEKMIEQAKTTIKECHIEKLIAESAFLRYDSLNELIKAMIDVGMATELPSTPPTSPRGSPEPTIGLDENSQAFLLELIVAVLISNKDRAGGIWAMIRDHIYSLLMGAAALEKAFLMERCVVDLLRIAKVLLRRPELANPILQSLRVILVLRPQVLRRVSLQLVAGIHEVLGVNADHILEPTDWAILFALLECAGAGAKPPQIINPETPTPPPQQSKLDETNIEIKNAGSVTNYVKSEEVVSANVEKNAQTGTDGSEATSPSIRLSRVPSPETVQTPGGWIMVGKEGEIEPVAVRSSGSSEWDIVHPRVLGEHQSYALLKAVDTIAFLVREHHITSASLPSCVTALRTFVEATVDGGRLEFRCKDKTLRPKKSDRQRLHNSDRASKRNPKGALRESKSGEGFTSDSESEDSQISYQHVSEKLLDLMDTLHSSASHILEMENSEMGQQVPDRSMNSSPWVQSSVGEKTNFLWSQALCPLLQGMARYCCDTRSSIRNLAVTYLQRALLNHDLQTLAAQEWESCFNKVLFPLLAKLLTIDNTLPGQPRVNSSMEETRIRVATLVQKVYLRHLGSLLSLPTFTALWLTLLDFLDKYLNMHRSDNLGDAIPEILKNMLLVMETTHVFHTSDGFTKLWTITWDRIDAFLPHFRNELFRTHPPSEIHRNKDPRKPYPSDTNESQNILQSSAISGSPTNKVSDSDIGRISPSSGEGQAVITTTRQTSIMIESTESVPQESPNPIQTDPKFHISESYPQLSPSHAQHEGIKFMDTQATLSPTEIPSLSDQMAAIRLSLSQEDIPTATKTIILQPPLPSHSRNPSLSSPPSPCEESSYQSTFTVGSAPNSPNAPCSLALKSTSLLFQGSSDDFPVSPVLSPVVDRTQNEL